MPKNLDLKIYKTPWLIYGIIVEALVLKHFMLIIT